MACYSATKSSQYKRPPRSKTLHIITPVVHCVIPPTYQPATPFLDESAVNISRYYHISTSILSVLIRLTVSLRQQTPLVARLEAFSPPACASATISIQGALADGYPPSQITTPCTGHSVKPPFYTGQYHASRYRSLNTSK